MEDEKNVLSKDYWLRLLWQANQVILPFAIAWLVFITTGLFAVQSFVEKHPIIEANQTLEIKKWVNDNYPPDELKQDMKEIKESINEINIKLAKIDS